MKDYDEIQKIQFEKASHNYDEMHGEVLAQIYCFLQEHFFSRILSNSVLDIGNGGQSPEQILGRHIAATATEFVGLDKSHDMFKRKKVKHEHVIGDALDLPFKDNSFDYILISSLIHHLGYSSKEENRERIQKLINEALRVARKQVIVSEPITPRLLEIGERLVARILGYMPTFVLSEYSLNECIAQMSIKKEESTTRSLAQLTSLFFWYNVHLEYEWLKLPAFMYPFKVNFFVLSKSGNL